MNIACYKSYGSIGGLCLSRILQEQTNDFYCKSICMQDLVSPDAERWAHTIASVAPWWLRHTLLSAFNFLLISLSTIHLHPRALYKKPDILPMHLTVHESSWCTEFNLRGVMGLWESNPLNLQSHRQRDKAQALRLNVTQEPSETRIPEPRSQ